MTVEIEVEGRSIPFALDWQNWRWHSVQEQNESDFPLIVVVGSKRYELYSDGTFAHMER